MIEKSVVLYMANDGGKKKCGRCVMYLKDTSDCSIHGKGNKVSADKGVCGLYLHGKPMNSKDHPPMTLTTFQESGYTEKTPNGTNCQTCSNKTDEKATECKVVNGPIEPMGCCNGWKKETLSKHDQMVKELSNGGI